MEYGQQVKFVGATYGTLLYGQQVKIVDTANRNCEYRNAGRYVVLAPDGKEYIVYRANLKANLK